MESMKLAFIGECMVELQETGTGGLTQTFGGDTLNSAIYCARLARNYPIEIQYITALGKDPFSQKMIAFWEKEGVRSDYVQCVEGERPGLYYIELDGSGERIFHYWRGEAAAKKCFEFPDSERVLNSLFHFNGVYVSGISLAIYTERSRENLLTCLAECKENGVSIYFDCNYRPHLWGSASRAAEVYKKLYPLSDIVFMTTEEGEDILEITTKDDIHAHLRDAGCGESVIKDGPGPCSIFAHGRAHQVDAYPVGQVVDTTAAGDSFSGVYLLARKLGCSVVESARMAHRTAAYVISHKGAIAPEDQMPVSSDDLAAASGA